VPADLQVLQTVALASLLAWASGLRLYLVVFTVGLAGHLGHLDLPAGLEVLQHPWVIGAAGILLVMEFLVDKVPGIDSIWDAVHTLIRIPAGALLAAGATGDTLGALTVAAGLLGGTITAGTHFTKAGGRALVNASPEPFSNWAASFTEDAMVLAGIWFAFQYPVVFLSALAVFAALAIWLLPKFWRGFAAMLRRLRLRYK
jgi:type II secretory pathway component PulF